MIRRLLQALDPDLLTAAIGDSLTGRATTNISYETLGQQRFARISGMHDAERKAAKVISDSITTRLASYFIGGG